MYVDADITIIDDTLDLLEDKRLYPDIEELALDAAHYYNELGLFEVSTRFYERKIQAISKIQNGVIYMKTSLIVLLLAATAGLSVMSQQQSEESHMELAGRHHTTVVTIA